MTYKLYIRETGGSLSGYLRNESNAIVHSIFFEQYEFDEKLKILVFKNRGWTVAMIDLDQIENVLADPEYEIILEVRM